METRNITLALPKELLRKVKVIAAERRTSVSRLLTEALEALATRDEAYEEAKRRDFKRLDHPRDLGTGGRASWTRDELHDGG